MCKDFGKLSSDGECRVKERRLMSAIEKPLGLYDYIVFAVLAIVCFLSFQQGDIMHTAGSSYGLLQGHILDYYDWVAYEYNIWDSYMPSTYFLFAIWNIPMKLFGIVVEPEQFADFWVIMWYKLLPTLFYIGSAVLVYKIALQIGMGSGKSKLCMYTFLTAPIGFFSQFIFGQYDSFTVFFLLLGLLYYFKKNNKLFILFIGLAIPFKLWPLLFFVPLLLLREKNIWKIIGNIILVAIPYAVEFVLYYPNEVFRRYVLGFGAVSYVSASGIDAGSGTISFVILLWGFLCACAYFQKPEDEVCEAKWSLFLCCMVIVALFGLSQWHPQWLLLAMPFFVLTTFINKKPKFFLAVDILMMIFFSVYVVNAWPNHVDQELFAWGIFGDYIYDLLGSKLMMCDLYLIMDREFLYTIFTALLVVSAVFKHPGFCVSDFKAGMDDCIKWIRARFLIGIGFFIIPAFICLISAACPPYLVYETSDAYAFTEPLLGRTISQVFVSSAEEIECISFRVATYSRKNDVKIQIDVTENDTGRLVYSTIADARKFKDNRWYKADVSGLVVEPGKEYRVTFSCDEATPLQCITFSRTSAYNTQPYGYAMIDDEIMDYHLCFEVYAAKMHSD